VRRAAGRKPLTGVERRFWGISSRARRAERAPVRRAAGRKPLTGVERRFLGDIPQERGGGARTGASRGVGEAVDRSERRFLGDIPQESRRAERAPVRRRGDATPSTQVTHASWGYPTKAERRQDAASLDAARLDELLDRPLRIGRRAQNSTRPRGRARPREDAHECAPRRSAPACRRDELDLEPVRAIRLVAEEPEAGARQIERRADPSTANQPCSIRHE